MSKNLGRLVRMLKNFLSLILTVPNEETDVFSWWLVIVVVVVDDDDDLLFTLLTVVLRLWSELLSLVKRFFFCQS